MRTLVSRQYTPREEEVTEALWTRFGGRSRGMLIRPIEAAVIHLTIFLT